MPLEGTLLLEREWFTKEVVAMYGVTFSRKYRTGERKKQRGKR